MTTPTGAWGLQWMPYRLRTRLLSSLQRSQGSYCRLCRLRAIYTANIYWLDPPDVVAKYNANAPWMGVVGKFFVAIYRS